MLKPDQAIKVFRYDINALRALAIIGVLFFHYKVKNFTGGFTGVDVFFVISGYLMSKIIMTGINNNKLSVIDFYGKRVKRIIPALLFMILVVSVACFFFFFPLNYKALLINAASSLSFVSNIRYWQTTNYFATGLDDNILLHTWSLSVEWQFYLLYPFILIGLSKLIKTRAVFFTVFCIITMAIFLGSVYFTSLDETASFYLLPSRSWEMFFGGIAFLGEDTIKGFKYRKLFAILGYAVIIACFIAFRGTMPWPGKFTFVPVFATMVIIICNVNDFKVLKLGATQFIGQISYSLYLWHWPVFVAAEYIGIEINAISIIVLMLISFTISYLSYTYIELNKAYTNKLILTGAVSLAMITIVASNFRFNDFIFKPKTIGITEFVASNREENRRQYKTGVCFITGKSEQTLDKSCLTLDEHKSNVLLIGDSHAAQFAASLRESLGKKGVNILQATASGCFPYLRPNGLTKCNEVMNYIYRDFIVSKKNKIEGVIISANWVNSVSRKDSSLLLNDIRSTVKYFEKYNVKVLILGQNETYNMTYPHLVATESEYGGDMVDRYINRNSARINAFLAKNFKDYYVDIFTYGKKPHAATGNTLYMSDKTHYTRYGADLAVVKILANTKTQSFLNSLPYIANNSHDQLTVLPGKTASKKFP